LITTDAFHGVTTQTMVFDKDQDTEILIAITEVIVKIDAGGGAARAYQISPTVVSARAV